MYAKNKQKNKNLLQQNFLKTKNKLKVYNSFCLSYLIEVFLQTFSSKNSAINDEPRAVCKYLIKYTITNHCKHHLI